MSISNTIVAALYVDEGVQNLENGSLL